MNDVGEPCAGEPHARFDAAAGGNRGPVGHAARSPDTSRRPYKLSAVADRAMRQRAARSSRVPVLGLSRSWPPRYQATAAAHRRHAARRRSRRIGLRTRCRWRPLSGSPRPSSRPQRAACRRRSNEGFEQLCLPRDRLQDRPSCRRVPRRERYRHRGSIRHKSLLLVARRSRGHPLSSIQFGSVGFVHTLAHDEAFWLAVAAIDSALAIALVVEGRAAREELDRRARSAHGQPRRKC